MAFAFMPPSIPDSAARAVSRSGCRIAAAGRSNFVPEPAKFLEACCKRPELAGVTTQFSASVPQIYADVDRDKALKQGVAVADVYQTLQAYLGGLFLNQFNRFGRQWRVFLQAEGSERRAKRTSINITCATTTAIWFRSRRS